MQYPVRNIKFIFKKKISGNSYWKGEKFCKKKKIKLTASHQHLEEEKNLDQCFVT